MRLLASTDFALRVLMRLGQQEPGEHVNVETLAQQLGGLSRNHLHKIVQGLTALGVLRTVRGAGGGVMLAVPLAEIRLGALTRTLEADQALVECFRADGGCCALEPGCKLRVFLRQARESFYQSLDERTLADCIGNRRRVPSKVSARGRAPETEAARRLRKA
jgi:Rrf2 family transcriptional regulator, nitric oxide-sensitive transcriptional repressor